MCDLDTIANALFEAQLDIVKKMDNLCDKISDTANIGRIIDEEDMSEFNDICINIDGYSKMAEEYEKTGLRLINLLKTGGNSDGTEE